MVAFIAIIVIVFIALAAVAPAIDALLEPKIYTMLVNSGMNISGFEQVWSLSLGVTGLLLVLAAVLIPLKHYFDKQKINTGQVFQDYKQLTMYIFLILASFMAVGAMLELNEQMTSYTVGIVEPNVDTTSETFEQYLPNGTNQEDLQGAVVNNGDKTIFSYRPLPADEITGGENQSTVGQVSSSVTTFPGLGIIVNMLTSDSESITQSLGGPLFLIQYFVINGFYAMGMVYLYFVLAVRNIMVLVSFIALPVGIALKTIPYQLAGGIGDRLIRLSLIAIFLPFLLSIMLMANVIPLTAVGIGGGLLQLEYAVIPLIIASVGWSLLKSSGIDTVQSGRTAQQAPAQRGRRYSRGIRRMRNGRESNNN